LALLSIWLHLPRAPKAPKNPRRKMENKKGLPFPADKWKMKNQTKANRQFFDIYFWPQVCFGIGGCGQRLV